MRYQLALAALVAASTTTTLSIAHDAVARNADGLAVQAISYIGWGSAGTYQQVTGMLSNGTCTYEQVSYAGGMAPLDKEVCARGLFLEKTFTNSISRSHGIFEGPCT